MKGYILCCFAFTAYVILYATGSSARGFATELEDQGNNSEGTIEEPNQLETVPGIEHVIVVWFENREVTAITGVTAPYFTSFANTYVNFTNFYGVSHPSQPNYLDVFSGSNQGVTNDNYCTFPASVDNLAKQLAAAGKSWRVYVQNYPGSCSDAQISSDGLVDGPGVTGQYVRKHNPAMGFESVRLNPGECANIQRLANFDPTVNFAFVTPNMTNDMHDGTTGQGDAFLQAFVPLVTSSPDWAHTLLIVSFDEGTTNTNGGGHIYTAGAAPWLAHANVATFYNHYSLLRTIEEIFGLPFLNNAASATTMTELFPLTGTPTPTPTLSPTPTTTATTTATATATATATVPPPTPTPTPVLVATVSLPIASVTTAVTNFSQPVTTTSINPGDNLVGFQGDFTFDSSIVTFQNPPISGAGLTANNWNVTGNVFGAGTIKTLRISAFSNDFTPLSGSGSLFNLNLTRISSTPGANTALTWGTSPNDFYFIDADLDTHSPGSTLPGSIAIQTTTINLAGAISYCSSPSLGPVPNVTLTLTGDAGGTTTSNASGNYTLSAIPSGGNYTVTPTKPALAPGSNGIDTVDVIATQRQFLGLGTPLSGCRLTAADVNGINGVDTVDVIAIQRFFLGLTSGIANSGSYRFNPLTRSYSGVGTDQNGQNYDALISGDVATPFADGF